MWPSGSRNDRSPSTAWLQASGLFRGRFFFPNNPTNSALSLFQNVINSPNTEANKNCNAMEPEPGSMYMLKHRTKIKKTADFASDLNLICYQDYSQLAIFFASHFSRHHRSEAAPGATPLSPNMNVGRIRCCATARSLRKSRSHSSTDQFRLEGSELRCSAADRSRLCPGGSAHLPADGRRSGQSAKTRRIHPPGSERVPGGARSAERNGFLRSIRSDQQQSQCQGDRFTWPMHSKL